MSNPDFDKVPSIVVAAAILERNGKVLLTKRKAHIHQGGLWEFPGGKREMGETLEDCLRRELKEEIDIEVDGLRHFHAFRHRYPEKEVELNFFTCSIYQGVPKALGCTEIVWVPRHELFSYEFPSANWPVLRKLLEKSHDEESNA